MAHPTLEEKFLRQAAKGSRHWRRQGYAALAVAGIFAAGAVWQLVTAAVTGERTMASLLGILTFILASVAAAMWQIHAETLLGAAVFLERQAAAERP